MKRGLLGALALGWSGIALSQTCDVTAIPVNLLAEAVGTGLRSGSEKEELAKTTSAKAVDVAEDLPTGPTVSGAATASTIANFLPLFSLTGLSGNLQGEDAGNTTNDDVLAFDFNIPLTKSERQLKIQAGFDRNPSVLDALVEAVPAAERDAFRTATEKTLKLEDDAMLSVTYNVQSKLLGRNRRLLDDVVTATLKNIPIDDYQTAFAAATAVIGRIASTDQGKSIDEIQFSANTQTNATSKNTFCVDLTRATDALAAASQALNATEDAAVGDLATEKYAKLLSNQPQLYFSTTFRDRNALVGPNEKSVSINYELGRANINRLAGFIREECGNTPSADCQLENFGTYMTDHDADIEAGDRFKFSLEYAETDDLAVTLVQPAVTFNKAGGEKLVATLAYGRSLSGAGLLEDARLDIELKREDVDHDPDRNDRTIGTLTLTRSVGGVSFPLSLVYANKPEFLRDLVDDKLSAHFGIKYEFSDKKK